MVEFVPSGLMPLPEFFDGLVLLNLSIIPSCCLGEFLTYIITVKNISDIAYNKLIVTDKLGRYIFNSRTVALFDFTYGVFYP